MKVVWIVRIMVTSLVLLLSSCGGGGGGVAAVGSGGGIGGSGFTTSGTIDGFGSIFVNGVEFETDEATIIADGEPADESLLGLGMVVLVSGTLNEDGITGTAESVTFDDDVQGPISAIETSVDADAKTLTILNLTIRVERTATVFDGVDFDTLSVGDLVEASGFFDADGVLGATRLEKKEDFVAGVSEVELKGSVSNLTATEFNLGGFVVDYSMADLSEVPGGSLVEGLFVEVKGTLEGTRITAAEIEEEDELSSGFEDDSELSVTGLITDYVNDGDFRVNGTSVDARSATFSPESLILQDGLLVEADGRWNGTTLVAEEVEQRSGVGGGGEVTVHASVASVSTSQGLLNLQLSDTTVTILVDSETQLEDKTEVANPLTLADLAVGDFVLVQGVLDGDSVRAGQLDRDEAEKNVVKAPVESFETGLSVTLLGATYSTAGAEFENSLDQPITEVDFYLALQVGDRIKIEDDQVPDGTAEEVDIED